jgi:hypothetical protein
MFLEIVFSKGDIPRGMGDNGGDDDDDDDDDDNDDAGGYLPLPIVRSTPPPTPKKARGVAVNIVDDVVVVVPRRGRHRGPNFVVTGNLRAEAWGHSAEMATTMPSARYIVTTSFLIRSMLL